MVPLAAELSGAARAAITNKKASWFLRDDGVKRLLVGNALGAYFKTLRRKRGETITSFCVRHREQ